MDFALPPDIVERLPIGCHQIDAQGKVQCVNQRELEILGYSREEMVGHFIWEFIRAEERDISQNAVLAKLGKRALAGRDYCRTFLSKDGLPVPILLNDLLLTDTGGTITSILSTVQDITLPEAVKQALKDPTALDLAIAFPIYVARKNTRGEFTFVNQRFADEVGFTPDQLKGKTDFDIYETKLAEKYQKDDQKVIESGVPLQTIEKHSPKNGVPKDVQVIKSPIKYDADGKVSEIQIVFWALIERESVIAALEDAVEKARADNFRLFENEVIGIFQSTPAGKYIRVNKMLASMLGYESPEEMRKINVSEIYADANERQQFVDKMAKDGRVEKYEYQVKRKDGTTFPIIEFAQAVKDSAGNVDFYEGFILDISERKNLQRRQRLESHERELALRFQRAMVLEDEEVFRNEVRRVLCAITTSDGMGVHRALFFRVGNTEMEGHCAIGPNSRAEASSYLPRFGDGSITFQTAMEGMDRPGYSHQDQLHRDVCRFFCPIEDLNFDANAELKAGRPATIDCKSVFLNKLYGFCQKHDMENPLVIPIMENGSAMGVLMMDCIYEGKEFPLDAREASIFSNLLRGLLTRARYALEMLQSTEQILIHQIKTEMMVVGTAIQELQTVAHSIPSNVIPALQNLHEGIDRKLQWHREVSKSSKYAPRETDIHDALQKVIERKNVGLMKYEFKTEFASQPLQVIVDPLTLEMIIDALFNNAWEARRDETKPAIVTVRTGILTANESMREKLVASIDPGRLYVTITVADEGKGIVEDRRPRLFLVYPGKSTKQSLGRALSSARSMLRKQGGDIVETSSTGQGACFMILLPSVMRSTSN